MKWSANGETWGNGSRPTCTYSYWLALSILMILFCFFCLVFFFFWLSALTFCVVSVFIFLLCFLHRRSFFFLHLQISYFVQWLLHTFFFYSPQISGFPSSPSLSFCHWMRTTRLTVIKISYTYGYTFLFFFLVTMGEITPLCLESHLLGLLKNVIASLISFLYFWTWLFYQLFPICILMWSHYPYI